MTDHLNKETRSWNMSRICGKDTKPEIAVRKILHAAGFRFRLHVKDLPGKPDIVLPKWKTVVFVHGCFWHRHEGCKDATTPKTRTEWWLEKYEKNLANDLKKRGALETAGLKVIVVWDCEVGFSGYSRKICLCKTG
jgi:DNA mismatch endonuclease (patch repair protein)